MAALLTCEINDMTQFLHFLLALVVILALAWLASYDRKKIRIRYIIQLIIIEVALAFFSPRRKRPVASEKYRILF